MLSRPDTLSQQRERHSAFTSPKLRDRSGFTLPQLRGRTGFTLLPPSATDSSRRNLLKADNCSLITDNRSSSAFTLIELLVVIAIIAALMGLLFPAFKGAQTQAKRTQAKNDLANLVTAVNAYNTEYGKYPIPDAQQGQNEDYTYSYDGAGTPSNGDLIKLLQNDSSVSAQNPKGIVFFTGPIAKTTGGYGIQPAAAGTNASAFFDPWGKAYSVCIDSDYNGKVRERGTGNLLAFGAIGWSVGESGSWDTSGIPSWK